MQRVLQYPAILILRLCVLRLLKARSMEQNYLEFHPELEIHLAIGSWKRKPVESLSKQYCILGLSDTHSVRSNLACA
jgi:hypothetical protein